MIEIGTLVSHPLSSDIGIIVDHWIEDKSGEYHTVVKWLTGHFTGKRTAEYNSHIKVIA